MPINQPPELSIIIPVFNETAELPKLFLELSKQLNIAFELILCDGGSTDNTLQTAFLLAEHCTYPVQSIKAPRGRASQMNAGAAIARGPILLFLHADSGFSEPDALRNAVFYFTKNQDKAEGLVRAGHFGLRFKRKTPGASLAYFFYEAKTHLNRPDCIRGDQGFMLLRNIFKLTGGFDESLPFLEDLKFAGAVANLGCWILLPGEIITSARRFETEGLYERQVTNAIITNCLVTGWEEFFASLFGLYRCHNETGRLQLFPLLNGIRTLLAKRTFGWQLLFWRATGKHVADNIWQLFFWLDVRRAFRNGQQPTEVKADWCDFFQRNLERFTHALPAQMVTALTVWIWFRMLLITRRHKENISTVL